jgi:DUF1680 family protein
MQARFLLLTPRLFALATFVIGGAAAEPRPAVPQMPPIAKAFTTGEVRLLPGPFQDSQDAAARYLLSLDLDRLLAPYRTSVGLPAKAPAYPGWETNTLPGVGLAFYLSGLARLQALSADGAGEYGGRMQRILDELAECQEKGQGYLLGTTNGRSILARVEREGYWKGFGAFNGAGEATPYYAMEKLFSGLRDAYRIARQPRALAIAVRLADWLERHLAQLDDARLEALMQVEFGGMNWVLADLYADTGDARYLAMARRWRHRWLTDALAAGRDELAGKHGNAQFPKISGLVAQYPFTGDAADLRTARFFWERVARHHSYATGGNSESEHFGPPDQLGGTLTPYTEENCNSYNMLRLTSLLHGIEPRGEYADFLERVMFNHLLPAQHRTDGRVCYFLPLAPGSKKVFEHPYEEFTCCVCSGMDSYVRHADYIYSRGADDLWVNLYAASELTWAEKGVTLRQETRFPFEEATTLRLRLRAPVQFRLQLRHPRWATHGMTVRINGVAQTVGGGPGEFWGIGRLWRDGDVVAVGLPLALRTEPLPGDPTRVALLAGPILLAGEVAASTAWPDPADTAATLLVSNGRPLAEWLKPGAEPLQFKAAVARPGEVRVKPFFQTDEELYTVYWEALSDEQWREREAQWTRLQAERQRREARTVDRVEVGNPASEAAHGFKGAGTVRLPPAALTPAAVGAAPRGTYITLHHRTGFLPERNYRVALAPSSFSYRLQVPKEGPADLVCTFFGRCPYPRPLRLNYQVKIDGVTVATEKVTTTDGFPTFLHEKVIALPPELTAGKSAIEVAFVPGPGGRTENVMEVRVVRR